ncbi:hypothetical protein [Marseilla massiliensis]|uniref:Uncharacterized protein n=1 Tax=Marseilla massiliensis TaxID=1841864 RepID=A0A938WMB7_9BACT|nr:hypothetical protein [Marseilla massiliensis]MBM6662596.1 hypothetical protein [Marseilla massiliensis]
MKHSFAAALAARRFAQRLQPPNHIAAYFHNKCKLIAPSFVGYTYFTYLCGDLDVKETIKF